MILKGKGGKDRIVPATSALVQRVNELALLDGVNEPDYLWYCRPGGGSMISRSQADRGLGVRPLVEALPRRGRRPLPEPARRPAHVRDSLAAPGGRLDLLSMAMGHASIKTTHDLYSHLDTTDLAAEFACSFRSGVDRLGTKWRSKTGCTQRCFLVEGKALTRIELVYVT